VSHYDAQAELSTATGYELDVQGSTAGKVGHFSVVYSVRTGPGAHSVFCLTGRGVAAGA
jgi:hypothetical protein